MTVSASVRRLKVYKAVVEAGGFSAAAASLGIAQPSVTGHVKALERQVGERLLRRGPGRTPHLTEAGEALYAYAADVVRRSVEADANLERLRGARAPKVIFAVQRGLTHSAFLQQLAGFVRRRSDVKLALHTGTNDDVFRLLREGTADLGLFLALGPVAGLQSEAVGSEPVVLVVAPSHPLARRKRVLPSELSDYPFLSGLADSYFSHLTDVALRQVGVRRRQIGMEVQDAATIQELACAGAGIACLLRNKCEDNLRSGALVPLATARPLAFEVRWSATPARAAPDAAFELIAELKRARALGQTAPASRTVEHTAAADAPAC
jgi:DNA-binding transcriptional LysR family regulator